MNSLSNLVTLTTGVYFCLGTTLNQKAIAANLGSILQDETIKEIQIQFDTISINPDTNTGTTKILIESQVKLINSEDKVLTTWFTTIGDQRNELILNGIGERVGVIFNIGGLSLYNNLAIRNDLQGNVFTADETNPRSSSNFNNIVNLLKNSNDDQVEFKGTLLAGSFPSFSESKTESNAFLISTSPIKPEVVPEPLTILGSGTAVAFGTFFKRKSNKNKPS
ncbi:PEP-CTERM sorting domain-containing protein [Crocosphaera sp. UHCC 0190]|uniref:PEP-CTERM sorting domain-containing protein n=1 Tax=Crocosphaera sp. UHCC 0190 TaxID=3110246 RepID=UPI002B1E9A88|nr:PEP-CTERM sorting domain-containing protein [Crocosphaera sp. UHCC 0190]MEA5508752.1 PEP-CTERM sorting domain-containing protein [Crocosphaera sp. UHCC 0190]